MKQEYINNASFWRFDNQDCVERLVAKAKPSEYSEPREDLAANPDEWGCEHWGWFLSDNKMFYELQVSESKDALWVHSSDGSTVGRFGKQGVDIHNTVTEQLNGASECRLCTHGAPTKSQWQLFIDRAYEYWGVIVPNDAFCPTLLAEETSA